MCKIDSGLQNFTKGLWGFHNFTKGYRSVDVWSRRQAGFEMNRVSSGDHCWSRRAAICLQMGVAEDAACPGWSFQELKLLQKNVEIALVAIRPADGCDR